MTALELRQKRKELWTKANVIEKKAADEKRSMTAEENQEVDRMIAEMDALKLQVEGSEAGEQRRKRLNELGEELERSSGIVVPPGNGNEAIEREKRTAAFNNAFDAYIRKGFGQMGEEQRGLMMAAHRDLSVGTSASGGYTVPQGFYNILTDALKLYTPILPYVTILDTASGNTMPVPTSNDTGNIGELISEATSLATDQDPVFGQISLGAYIYSSRLVYVSMLLLQDSAFDLMPKLAEWLAMRIARLQNNHFTTGTGTGQPKGIVPAATLGVTGTTGQTTTILYDDVVDLIYSVDALYRPNARFMASETMIKTLRKLKDSQGHPLWQPSLAAGDPDVLLGYNIVPNNSMAVPAASAKSLIFGDLRNYIVRRVREIQMIRSELHIDKLQIGFAGFHRADGNLIDAGTHPVKYYAHPAT